MKKVDAFCKIIDALNDDEKDKLLISAKELMKAQKAVQVDSAETKIINKQKSKKTVHDKNK